MGVRLHQWSVTVWPPQRSTYEIRVELEPNAVRMNIPVQGSKATTVRSERSAPEPKVWLWGPYRHLETEQSKRFSGAAWHVQTAEDLIQLAKRFPDVIGQLESGEQSPQQAYEELMIREARRVAESFLPVHRSTHGTEGFAGVEISAELAYDTGGLVDEALRLRAAIPLPNVMIQIPGTHEALLAIRRLAGAGLNLNLTRIVSLSSYVQAARAYIRGMKDRGARGESLLGMTCAATVFLDSSDLRSAISREPEEAQGAFRQNSDGISGEMAAGAIKALLSAHGEILSGDEFPDLALKGARPPSPMWIAAEPGTCCEIAYDLTSVDPNQLLATLGNADIVSRESRAAGRILDLFLQEYSDGESVMDCLQRAMIVDEVTRLDHVIRALGEWGH